MIFPFLEKILTNVIVITEKKSGAKTAPPLERSRSGAVLDPPFSK